MWVYKVTIDQKLFNLCRYIFSRDCIFFPYSPFITFLSRLKFRNLLVCLLVIGRCRVSDENLTALSKFRFRMKVDYLLESSV